MNNEETNHWPANQALMSDHRLPAANYKQHHTLSSNLYQAQEKLQGELVEGTAGFECLLAFIEMVIFACNVRQCSFWTPLCKMKQGVKRIKPQTWLEMWHRGKEVLEQLAVAGQNKKKQQNPAHNFELCKYISKLATTDKLLTANNINTLPTCDISD